MKRRAWTIHFDPKSPFRQPTADCMDQCRAFYGQLMWTGLYGSNRRAARKKVTFLRVADNCKLEMFASAAVVSRFNHAGRRCFPVLCFGPEHVAHHDSQISQRLRSVAVKTRAMHNGEGLRFPFR